MRFFPGLTFGIALFFGLLGLTPSAYADFFTLGISGGLSAASTTTTNVALSGPGTVVLANQTLSGLSYAGGLSICLLQDSILGFEIAEDYQNINASSGVNTYQGSYAITNASAHFTFKWVAHYHQFGVGYAYLNFLNSSTSPSVGVPTVFNGFTINAKDYLIVDKKKGPFITARLFFFTPGGNYSPISTLSFMLGFDI